MIDISFNVLTGECSDSSDKGKYIPSLSTIQLAQNTS